MGHPHLQRQCLRGRQIRERGEGAGLEAGTGNYLSHLLFLPSFPPLSFLLPLQLAFKWFDNGMNDLEHETQVFMFNLYVLKVDPAKLDSAGYHCLRNFFETINLGERKLKKISASYQSLVGVAVGVARVWLESHLFFRSCSLSRIKT